MQGWRRECLSLGCTVHIEPIRTSRSCFTETVVLLEPPMFHFNTVNTLLTSRLSLKLHFEQVSASAALEFSHPSRCQGKHHQECVLACESAKGSDFQKHISTCPYLAYPRRRWRAKQKRFALFAIKFIWFRRRFVVLLLKIRPYFLHTLSGNAGAHKCLRTANGANNLVF